MPVFSSLTPRQSRALRVVLDHIERRGVAPTIVEVSEAMGLSHKMGSYEVLNALEWKGYIKRTPGRARGLVVLKSPDGEPIEHKAA